MSTKKDLELKIAGLTSELRSLTFKAGELAKAVDGFKEDSPEFNWVDDGSSIYYVKGKWRVVLFSGYIGGPERAFIVSAFSTASGEHYFDNKWRYIDDARKHAENWFLGGCKVTP